MEKTISISEFTRRKKWVRKIAISIPRQRRGRGGRNAFYWGRRQERRKNSLCLQSRQSYDIKFAGGRGGIKSIIYPIEREGDAPGVEEMQEENFPSYSITIFS